jgi:hypothetical protein
MTEEATFSIAPTRHAPIDVITPVLPKHYLCTSKCEEDIDIGFFFDGTRNNKYEDENELKQSNIARLFDAYLNDTAIGAYASFTPAGLHEATGYWRYRKGFRGGSEATIASNDANNQNTALG